MNHSTLKNFAAKARVDLIDQVGARLQYVLSSDSVELRERAFALVDDLKSNH